MSSRNDQMRLLRGQGRTLSLYCMALLVLVLAGCASTDGRSSQSQSLLSNLSSCEQDLLDIKLALCSGELEAKPGTDPHEVIGLAKPGTDPHSYCFSSFRLSAAKRASCSCEFEKFKLLAKIKSCFDKAGGDGGKYTTCLDTLESTAGVNCPSP